MRRRSLRFDIWVCLLAAYLVGFGVGKIMDQINSSRYEEYVEEHTAKEGDVGSKAGKNVVRVNNIKELLENKTFTVVSPGIKYRNEGGGYYEGKFFQSLALPSGERVAVYINEESVQHSDESIYTGEATLPIGKVVKEDLKKEETFINQIEHKDPLTRTDFYIDMVGQGAKMSEEDYKETGKVIPQFIAGIITFCLCHTIGSKLGIFPAFFSFKKRKSEWD